MSATKEYREKIAQAFVNSLEGKQLNWNAEWGNVFAVPSNAVTQSRYHGINRFWLSIVAARKGYGEDSRWATFKQIQSQGWHLKKGSMGEKVEYWLPYDFDKQKSLTWEEFKRLQRSPDFEDKKIRLIAKYFTVFHAKDIEGIPSLPPQEKVEVSQDALIQKISANMQVSILNDGGDRAYYSIKEDKIHLPPVSSFLTSYAYNATALHELAHSTGAQSRLNRNIKNMFGSAEYAYEELIAEISASFMGINLQTQHDSFHMNNHKAYVQFWIQSIKEKPETLIMAIREAEKAADYLEHQADLIPTAEYQKLQGNSQVVDTEVIADILGKRMEGPIVESSNQKFLYGRQIDRYWGEKKLPMIAQEDFNDIIHRVKKPNFENCFFDRVNLVGLNLEEVSFSGTRFNECRLDKMNLEYCDFSKASFHGCDILNCNLNHSNFQYAKIYNVQILDTSIKQVDFSRADLQSTILKKGTELYQNEYLQTMMNGVYFKNVTNLGEHKSLDTLKITLDGATADEVELHRNQIWNDLMKGNEIEKSISGIHFREDGYIDFLLDVDGYELQGLYQMEDATTGTLGQLVNVKCGEEYAIVERGWALIEKTLRKIENEHQRLPEVPKESIHLQGIDKNGSLLPQWVTEAAVEPSDGQRVTEKKSDALSPALSEKLKGMESTGCHFGISNRGKILVPEKARQFLSQNEIKEAAEYLREKNQVTKEPKRSIELEL